MIRTTVIIPNYNGIKYLGDCLESLRGAEGEFKVLVVDNGSTDGSLEVASAYDDTRVIALKENTGFAHAVNVGIEAADTEYVLLLNNDITVERDFVTALERTLSANPGCFSVNSKMLSMWDHSKIDGCGDYYCALGWAYAYGKDKNAGQTGRFPKRIFSACGGASLYRRNVLLELGGFDDAHFAYLEDVDLGYRARLSGYYNLYEPVSVCYHAGSGSSGSRYNEFKIKLAAANSIYLIHKNMPALQILLNLPLLACGFIIKALFFAKKGYGSLYLKGLLAGFLKGHSAENRDKRVHFDIKRLPNYVLVELELIINVFRRFFA